MINAQVAYGPQRQLGLDRASRRHGGVYAEQLYACLVLMARSATGADKSRSTKIPSSEVARFRETSAPQPTPVLACVSFLRRETALCGRLRLDRPSFSSEPLVECGGLAFDRANADRPVLVVRVSPLILAANVASSNMRAQSICRPGLVRPSPATTLKPGHAYASRSSGGRPSRVEQQ